VLVVGFAIMLVLMLFIMLIGLRHLQTMEQQLEQIVANHMVKIRLATRMHQTARERTISLQKMILLSDPFDRDEELMRIHHFGAEFGDARQRLLAMDLTEAERELLREQADLTRQALPLQERTVELATLGETTRAHALLVEGAIPAQDRVLVRLQRLYSLQEEAAANATAAALAARRTARLWMLLLSGGALGLAIGIALHVIGRSRRTEASLQQEKERAQVTLHSIGEGVIRTDQRGNIEYLNPVAERLTGWSIRSAHGMPLLNVLRLRDEAGSGNATNPLTSVLQDGETVTSTSDLALQTARDAEYAIELTAAPIHGENNAIAGAVLVFRDVTEMRTLARELSYQASHDALTGLLNRREFERLLQQLLDGARRHDQTHALGYIDLDLFKVINDTCGHIAGDELLRQLGLALRARLRKSDVLARLGGDEFGVLLANCPLDMAEQVVAGLQQAIHEFRFVWEDKSFEVAASIGLAPITAASGSLSDLLRTADLACYAAKDAGRNRVHVARTDDAALAERQSEVQWVQHIRRALVENRFLLQCQRIQALGQAPHAEFATAPSLARGPAMAGSGLDPIGELATEASMPRSPRLDPIGERYEILVRLIDDAGNVVYPRTFLPVAERYQLMPALDRWVLRQALAMLKSMPAQLGPALAGFNINLSGQSLGEAGFRDFLVQELKASGVPPQWICFEITETATVANLSRATELLGTLKELGCQFALDDFGSGLSSFAYLKNLPVDYLKIDGAFIRDMLHDRADHAMVASIHQLAHLLGIKTVAEYVESDEILAAVVALGIDCAQGYAIGMPSDLVATLAALAQPTGRTGTA
jgi:diguanylate cyclase (GGDEF)-like protein/PAS domain S-box-containing protein